MKKMFVLLSVMIISFPVSAATLKQGDSSEQVVKLQQALLDGGYFSGIVDGEFETTTEEAVRKYQEESGVTADGVVNDIQYMNLTFESIDNPEKVLQIMIMPIGFNLQRDMRRRTSGNYSI